MKIPQSVAITQGIYSTTYSTNVPPEIPRMCKIIIGPFIAEFVDVINNRYAVLIRI